MDQGTTLKNVNVLDMRKTPKETIDKLAMIRNVNVLLVSPETAGFVPGIPTKNLNAVAQVPADVEIQTCMSSLTINANYLRSLPSARFLLVMGRVIVEDDVTAELIEEKIDGLVVMGMVVCPESVTGTLQSKAKVMMGKTISYAEGSVLVTSSLSLDDTFLQGLPDATRLVVTSSLRVIDNVTDSLLEKKLQSLLVVGTILSRREHELALKSKLERPRDMIVIPTGHQLVEGMLTLDAMSLQSLDDARLFSMGDILISDDVEAEALDRSVAHLESLGSILCPAELKDVLRTKCDMLGNRVILFEGALWYVNDDRQLLAEQFEYIDGLMTIVNRANLTIGGDVSAQMLLDHVAKIHNLGDIECRPEHISAVEARLGIRDGNIQQEKQAEQPADEGPQIGNANMMVL
jgi:hypothetical protein